MIQKKIIESDEDEPLAKHPAKNKVTTKETEPEKDSEEEKGVRRSARVKSLKAKKREATPEYSSYEEEGAETSDYNLDSEDDTSDEDFKVKGRNARRQADRKSMYPILSKID